MKKPPPLFAGGLFSSLWEESLRFATFRVGEEGFEPSHPFGHTDLNRARLPFRHSPVCVSEVSTEQGLAGTRLLHANQRHGYDRLAVEKGGARGCPTALRARLEGMVEGAFARAFKSELQPVEVASAIQREMDERAAIVARVARWCRTTSSSRSRIPMAERLAVYADSLSQELANLAREHAKEQGYSFVGPVRVRFENADDLAYGHVPDSLRRHPGRDGRGGRDSPADERPAAVEVGAVARVGTGCSSALEGDPKGDQLYVRADDSGDLARPGHRLRSSARRSGGFPASCREPGRGPEVVPVDLGSTNGTFVNGQPVRRVELQNGTRSWGVRL